MIDAIKSYVQLATGLTEMTARKALVSATALVSSLPDVLKVGQHAVPNQVQDLADDLVEQSRSNRDLIVGLVRTEVDRTVGRMGFIREEELAAVRRHVARLEAELASLRASNDRDNDS